MKNLLLLVAFTVCTGTVTAADQSETGVPLSPLKIYSGGIGVGAVRSLNQELKETSSNFLRLSILNSFSIRDHLSLFFDVDWLLPGTNFGADLGLDAVFTRTDFRPFAGVGLGGHYIDRSGDFGKNFGPSITAHAGCIIDLTESVAVRMRIPYHLILNKTNDHMVGLEFTFLFSSRFKKVQKLNYN
jgi:hypothetical protein